MLFKRFSFSFEFETEIGDKSYCVIYEISFEWKQFTATKGKILKEILKVKSQDSQKYEMYIFRSPPQANYKSSIQGRCDKLIQIDLFELVINKINSYDNLFYIKLINEINNINAYISKSFDVQPEFKIMQYSENDSIETNIERENDISKTLYNLKMKYRSKYDLLINTMMDLFPTIEEIRVEKINFVNDEKYKRLQLCSADYTFVCYVKRKT